MDLIKTAKMIKKQLDMGFKGYDIDPLTWAKKVPTQHIF